MLVDPPRLSVPDHVMAPVRGNLGLMEYIDLVDAVSGVAEDLRENDFSLGEVKDILLFLRQTDESLSRQYDELQNNLSRIKAWSSNEDLELVSVRLGTSKSLEELVRSDKSTAEDVVRNVMNSTKKYQSDLAKLIRALVELSSAPEEKPERYLTRRRYGQGLYLPFVELRL